MINAVIGLHQEGKAAESVRRAAPDVDHHARASNAAVNVVEIPAKEFVPGDIMGFEAGNKVSTNGRMLVAATLEIEEAGLTGESTPVAKVVEPLSKARTCPRRPESTWPT